VTASTDTASGLAVSSVPGAGRTFIPAQGIANQFTVQTSVPLLTVPNPPVIVPPPGAPDTYQDTYTDVY
jgi:hypothetical protein